MREDFFIITGTAVADVAVEQRRGHFVSCLYVHALKKGGVDDQEVSGVLRAYPASQGHSSEHRECCEPERGEMTMRLCRLLL